MILKWLNKALGIVDAGIVRLKAKALEIAFFSFYVSVFLIISAVLVLCNKQYYHYCHNSALSIIVYLRSFTLSRFLTESFTVNLARPRPGYYLYEFLFSVFEQQMLFYLLNNHSSYHKLIFRVGMVKPLWVVVVACSELYVQ